MCEVGLRQLLLGLLYLLLNLGQLALEGQRTLCARTAAGDGDVVEGLAGGREEERLRVRERERARGVGVRRDEAFAQLGQDHFERLAEAVQDADAVLQRDDAFDAFDVGLGGARHAFGEGEVGLGVVGMNEEGGAAGYVGLEQMHAGVGGIPALDDDVVQLVAQELVDDALVLAIDFEEVGERAYGSHAVGVLLVGVGLEDVADRVGRVAVLADEGFERVAAAIERRDFAAQLVAAALGLRSLRLRLARSGGEARRSRLRAASAAR